MYGHVDVIKLLLRQTEGRDKAMKVAQYILKLLLLKWKPSTRRDKSKNIASQLSLARKLIRLMHWIDPLSLILKPPKHTTRYEYLGNCISLANDFSDDVVCLGTLGLIPQRAISIATFTSDRLWMLSIFMDLHDSITNYSRAIRLLHGNTIDCKFDVAALPKTSSDLHAAKITIMKLICDLAFCAIDVFTLKARLGETPQVVAGFVAGVLGTGKMYIKIRAAQKML